MAKSLELNILLQIWTRSQSFFCHKILVKAWDFGKLHIKLFANILIRHFASIANSFELNLQLQIWPRKSQLLSKIYRKLLAKIFIKQFATKPYSRPETFKNFILNILPINRSNNLTYCILTLIKHLLSNMTKDLSITVKYILHENC